MSKPSWFIEEPGIECEFERWSVDHEFEGRSYYTHFTSDHCDVCFLEDAFVSLLGSFKNSQSVEEGIDSLVRKAFAAGLLALAKDLDNSHARLLMKWVQKQLEERRKKHFRWYSKFYPILIKGKIETINAIDETITGICNYTGWEPERTIKEAFTTGLRMLYQKVTKDWRRGREIGWVYGLVDPQDHEVHYVGCSIHPVIRWQEHLDEQRKSNGWLEGLKRLDLKPDIRILETAARSELVETEAKWIEFGTVAGWPLSNVRGV